MGRSKLGEGEDRDDTGYTLDALPDAALDDGTKVKNFLDKQGPNPRELSETEYRARVRASGGESDAGGETTEVDAIDVPPSPDGQVFRHIMRPDEFVNFLRGFVNQLGENNVNRTMFEGSRMGTHVPADFRPVETNEPRARAKVLLSEILREEVDANDFIRGVKPGQGEEFPLAGEPSIKFPQVVKPSRIFTPDERWLERDESDLNLDGRFDGEPKGPFSVQLEVAEAFVYPDGRPIREEILPLDLLNKNKPLFEGILKRDKVIFENQVKPTAEVCGDFDDRHDQITEGEDNK